MSDSTPRSAMRLKSWQKAREIHGEVRSSLLEAGWKPDERPDSFETSATEICAAKLFPVEWFQTLNEELLADLIVDSFASTLSDAFVDGAILLYDLEAKNGAQPHDTLATSSSAPSLRQRGSPVPRLMPAKTPFSATPTPVDFRGSRRGAVAAAGTHIVGPRDGFTQAGLPQDEREAWLQTQYHACQPLQDYRSRIHTATELQRPKRHHVRPREGPIPQTKYVWPSTKGHFPEYWETMTQKKQFTRPTGEVIEETNPVLTVSEQGKSVIPYSLALHKAFIESQAPNMREKAAAIVPLKLTNTAADFV